MTVIEEPVTAEVAPQPALVRRFEPIERFAHWWVVFFFAMTALSGASLGDERTGVSPTLTWHLVSAGAFVVGLILLPVLPGR